MIVPAPSDYSLQDPDKYITSDKLTKREQVALAVLPQMLTDYRKFEDAVKKSYEVADLFLKEQS